MLRRVRQRGRSAEWAPATQRVAAADAGALVAAAQLGGRTSFVLADMKSGRVLAERGADLPMPPASTAKTVTSLYALETLGRGYRFSTRLLATGPIWGGTLKGDLILVGGGDPTLSSDNLGDIARALSAAGLKRVSGQFAVWAGALPLYSGHRRRPASLATTIRQLAAST